jgi:hypothetical protein
MTSSETPRRGREYVAAASTLSAGLSAKAEGANEAAAAAERKMRRLKVIASSNARLRRFRRPKYLFQRRQAFATCFVIGPLALSDILIGANDTDNAPFGILKRQLIRLQPNRSTIAAREFSTVIYGPA